jgi:hypothetical protein
MERPGNMHTHPIAGPLVRSIHAATLSMQHQLLSMQHQLMNIASYRQMRKGPTCYRMTGVAADYGRSDRVRCATRFAAIRAPAMRRLKERHDRSGISMNYLSLLPGAAWEVRRNPWLGSLYWYRSRNRGISAAAFRVRDWISQL